MGSRDRSLSVWMTALQRPLVVVKDLFTDSILDVSWNTDHNIMLACSTDGTVAGLQFDANELGTPLNVDDKNALYQRMYGRSIDVNAQPDKDMIIEFAELVNVNQQDKSQSALSNGSLATVDAGVMPSTTAPSFNLVVEHNNNIDLDQIVSTTTQSSSASSSLTVKTAIHKQIESRTANGKRRITPMFIPLDDDMTT